MLAQDTADDGLDIIDSLQSGITDFFTQLFGFLPNLIGFVAILVIGWFVARLVARMARRLFAAINLDHYLDRAGIGGPLERAGYADSGRFVAKILYYTVQLIVLKLAFGAPRHRRPERAVRSAHRLDPQGPGRPGPDRRRVASWPTWCATWSRA